MIIEPCTIERVVVGVHHPHFSLLRLGPDLDEVLEDLDGLRDVGHAAGRGDGVGGRGRGGVGGEVEHEDGGEADGEVLRVHLVARVLRRHPGQVVHHLHQAVLEGQGEFPANGPVGYHPA